MNTTTSMNDAPEAAPVAPPKVRMDRSRTFSTIHGERVPGDKYAMVHFIQDGIPADASGHFLFDHPDMLEKGPVGDARRKAAERKIKRALANAVKEAVRKPKPAEDDADVDGDETEAIGDENDDLLDPVNLEAWLRGEQDVEWNDVSQEIARRFKKRVAKIGDAVEFLVKEGVVPKAQLRKKFQQFAD